MAASTAFQSALCIALTLEAAHGLFEDGEAVGAEDRGPFRGHVQSSFLSVLASPAHIGSHPPQHFSQGPPIITGLIFHEAAQFAFGEDPELLKYD